MILQYPAKITFSKRDKTYIVEFPDLPGCLTYGDTIEEAQSNAKEALTGFLESIDGRKLDIPRPSALKGKDIFPIEPETSAGFAIKLKLVRAEIGLSQKEAAERLGIRFPAYQKYENPKKANPTLKTIERIEKAFGRRLVC